ncbi:hypothetical protein [Agromyces sp. ZXT2-3]|uniref:hypothetical protein n=1 Tax=Agromyces sp. ZXT2-3 TaxID=3461152 RepID=UPI004054CBE6
MPEPAPPLPDAEIELARLADADAAWDRLLSTYPDAERPADPFETYIAESDLLEVRRACYDTAGLQIEEGHAATDPDGPAFAINPLPASESEAIAVWVCETVHPIKRSAAGPTDAELGWIYDYLVAYSAPCLAANGIDNPPPAPREEWVSKWPDYVWFPNMGTAPIEPEREQALFELCLDIDTKMAEHRAEQG